MISGNSGIQHSKLDHFHRGASHPSCSRSINSSRYSSGKSMLFWSPAGIECQAWPAAYISNRATTEKDEKPDPNLRVLEVMKSNYRPIGKTITLKWNNGLF